MGDVWALVHAERAALIEDLELLDTAAWQQASCAEAGRCTMSSPIWSTRRGRRAWAS